MSVDTTLDSGLGLLLAKARSGLGSTGIVATPGGGTTVSSPRPATVNFEWGGGGVLLVQGSCDPLVVEIPFACRISWAHVRCGDAAGNPVAVTAQIDVQLSQYETFGGNTPLYGTGSRPSLSSASKSNTSLSGWKIDLSIGDTITGRVASFVGAATWLSLVLLLQPTEVPITVTQAVDSLGNNIVDSNGNLVVKKGPN